MPSESFAHAAKVLRDSDPDRYISTLALPQEHRDGITALLAFNAEVAGIREKVNGPAPGEIRLQWWNDALKGDGHGAVRNNPVADALLETLARYALPPGTLQRLIGARRFDLYDDPMPDLETFEGYAGETASTLLQLSAMILNGGLPVEPGDAAGHLGVAQAMVGHLRAFGYVSQQGRIMLPWSILEANGVRETEVFSGIESEGLHEALGQIAEIATAHLGKARAAIAEVPAAIKPAFAIYPIVSAQLKRWKRSGTKAFAAPAGEPDWQKIARVGWWSLRNR